jgi:uncharacterized membrane protein
VAGASEGLDPGADWLLATYVLYVMALRPGCRWSGCNTASATSAARAGPGPVPAPARRLYRIWFALGWPGFGALVAVFWLMISKPDPLF